jgi:metallo-beta-lactamase class B
MLLKLARDLWLPALGTLVVLFMTVAFPAWRDRIRESRQAATADPFRIAGNLYFVGTNDVTSFLLTGPAGDVVIDGASPEQEGMIETSITKLGFDVKDVAVILSTDPTPEHAGSLDALQKASGAELWSSDVGAEVLAAGGTGVDRGRLTFLTHLPIFRYPPPRVDHRFADGETVHLGPLALTAHITPHKPGCTTWTFVVRDSGRDLNVVHRCNLEAPPSIPLIDPEPAARRADFERSFRTLRSLPVDIWISGHGREWGRYRKYSASRASADPVAPFIDRDGYLNYIDQWEKRFREQ